jgi:hypothetical protein
MHVREQIYATSEERKQRNRQAQAAFRERRTEYIKQLESTIKRNEDSLQSLQQSHRSAADECLMLRYKNSLLERILLEKGKRAVDRGKTTHPSIADGKHRPGIDVQAELRVKTSNATGPGPVKAPKQSSPLERAAISRTSAQRHGSGSIAPKPDPTSVSQQRDAAYHMRSPQLQPTPPSHVSSPSTGRSPRFALQGAMSPKGPDFQAQHQPQQHGLPSVLSQPRGFPHANQMGMTHAEPMDPSAAPSMMPGGVYYPRSFQKHYDQLGKLTPPESFSSWSSVRPRLIRSCTEQEYDAQADMIDDPERHDDRVESHPYVPDFNQPPGQARMGVSGADVDPGLYGAGGPLFGQFEPMLDTDSFGLSASMQFQTPFSYEQNQHLRQH